VSARWAAPGSGAHPVGAVTMTGGRGWPVRQGAPRHVWPGMRRAPCSGNLRG